MRKFSSLFFNVRVQSPIFAEKHFLKRNVLTKPLKLVKELGKRILLGIEFHSLGATTWKALSPVFDFVGGTASRF